MYRAGDLWFREITKVSLVNEDGEGSFVIVATETCRGCPCSCPIDETTSESGLTLDDFLAGLEATYQVYEEEGEPVLSPNATSAPSETEEPTESPIPGPAPGPGPTPGPSPLYAPNAAPGLSVFSQNQMDITGECQGCTSVASLSMM